MQNSIWTLEEIALLRQYYRRMPAEELQALLKRSASAIRAKANSLGLSGDRPRPVSPVQWTDDELALLGKVSDAEVAKQKRVSLDIARRARVRRGIPAKVPVEWRRWTKEQIALLGTMPDASLGKMLGRSQPAVRKQRIRLGIAASVPHTVWTSEMDAMLGSASDREISARLGVPYQAVKYRRKHLGIQATRKPHTPRDWPQEVIDRLGKVPDVVIAQQMGVDGSAVSWKRRKLGIAPYRKPAKVKAIKDRRGVPKWAHVSTLNQPDFYRAMSAHHQAVTGKPLTHAMLSDLCLWSISRLQKWFTPGSAQQPLALPVRHHIWLVVCHGITERDPN